MSPPGLIARTVATAQGTGDPRFGEVDFEAVLRQLDRDAPTYRE
jgi:hypothetical protein